MKGNTLSHILSTSPPPHGSHCYKYSMCFSKVLYKQTNMRQKELFKKSIPQEWYFKVFVFLTRLNTFNALLLRPNSAESSDLRSDPITRVRFQRSHDKGDTINNCPLNILQESQERIECPCSKFQDLSLLPIRQKQLSDITSLCYDVSCKDIKIFRQLFGPQLNGILKRTDYTKAYLNCCFLNHPKVQRDLKYCQRLPN